MIQLIISKKSNKMLLNKKLTVGMSKMIKKIWVSVSKDHYGTQKTYTKDGHLAIFTRVVILILLFRTTSEDETTEDGIEGKEGNLITHFIDYCLYC